MCTMPPGQTDTPSGLDMNMHFGRMSLEGTGLTRGLSGYSNGLTNALSTGLDVTGGQVVGSAPSHVGGGGGNAGFMPHIDAPPLHTAFNSAAAAAAAATYASRLTAPELPMSPDALSATTPAEIAAAAAAAARGVGGPGLSALSRSVPRTASGGWAAVAAQRKRTLNALATMAGAQAGGGFPGDAAALGLLNGGGFAAGAGAGGKAPRLWSLLSPKLRNEVQQMLAHLPGIRVSSGLLPRSKQTCRCRARTRLSAVMCKHTCVAVCVTMHLCSHVEPCSLGHMLAHLHTPTGHTCLLGCHV